MIKLKIYFIAISSLFLIQACKSTKINSKNLSKKNTVLSDKNVESEYSLFFQAEQARLLDQNNKALTLYKQFIILYPNNATAYYNLSKIEARLYKFADAENHASKAVLLDPDNKYFQLFYADLLSANKKNKKALEVYENLEKKFPGMKEEYLYKKYLLYSGEGDNKKALESLNELENEVGFSEELIYLKRNIYLKNKQYDSAIYEVKKMVKEEPQNPRYLLQIANIYEEKGDKKNAQKILEEIKEKFPNEASYQLTLAQKYLQNNDSINYKKILFQLLENKNIATDEKITFLMPVLQNFDNMSQIEQDEIILPVKKIVSEDSTNKEMQMLLADLYYYSKKKEEAKIQYFNYLKIDKMRYQVWSSLMNIYSEQLKWDSLIDLTKQSIDFHPDQQLTYYYKGIAEMQLKQNANAIHSLNTALKNSNNVPEFDAQIFSLLGDNYNETKKYKYSDSCYEKALSINPNDATVLNNYAYYLSVRKERLNDAEKMSKKSLEIDSNSGSFLDTYGWILFEKGDYISAKKYIEKAISKTSEAERATLYEHLGDINIKLKDKENALKNWKKAIELGGPNESISLKIKNE